MKKINLLIILTLIFLGFVSVFFINKWADAGHGKLSRKLAVGLQLMEYTV